MGTQDEVTTGRGFELVSLPQPMTVRDPDTGQIVDGYKVVVRSTRTGATAELEIPKDRYSVAYVEAQAKAQLAPLDETVAAFGAANMTGASAASQG